MATTKLTIAVAPNDRTLPLMAGLVAVEGAMTEFITAPLESMFASAFDEARYDVSELSFSNYLYLTSIGACPYVGLPIFPSRTFRHSAIYIRSDRGIRSPRDLAGRIVGVREYTMTAALVARGLLEDEFGLKSQDVRWRYGRADCKDALPIARVLPRNVDIAKIDDNENLSDMLAEGRIDALIAYKPPAAYLEAKPHVRRLFEDWPSLERDYARRTGHFPIMHLVGVRRDILDRSPDMAIALCKAFHQSMAYSLERLGETQAPYTMLPWHAHEAASLQREFGHPLWSYGIPGNEDAIRALCRYSVSQGIAARELRTEDLFAAQTLAWVPGQ